MLFFGVQASPIEVMTSTYSIGTIRSVASLLAATFYQGNPDRNHRLRNIGSTVRSCTCIPRLSKIATLTYNRATSVIIKNAIILNIIHNIFNIRETEVVICIILDLLKTPDGSTII